MNTFHSQCLRNWTIVLVLGLLALPAWAVMPPSTAIGASAGSGDGRIHILPSLSAPSIKNGDAASLQAIVKAAAGVARVEARIEREDAAPSSPPVATVTLKGDPLTLTGANAGTELGLWQAEWIGRGLSEGYYRVAVTVTDRTGHTHTDRSLRFSDPIAGKNTVGTAAYPSDGMRRLDVAVMDAGENAPRCAVIDTANGFAYFGTDTAPGIVVKVALGNGATPPSRVAAITLNSGEDNLRSAVIDPANGFAYFGTATSPGIAVKVDIDPARSFARIGAVAGSGNILAPENNFNSAVIDTVNGYAYFGTTNLLTGRVVKIDVDPARTFERVDVASMTIFQNTLISAVIDTANGYAYFGTGESPGLVFKVDIDPARTFERTATITLPTGDNNLASAVIDPANGFAYFGTSTSPGRVVKVDVDPARSFAQVGTSLVLSGGVSSLTSAVIDTASGYAFFGTNGSPGTVAKVDVNPARTFVEKGKLALNPAENDLECAVIDTANGLAYFGANTTPGNAVRVGLYERGFLKATKFTMAEIGNVDRVPIYSHSASGSLRMAIYDSGANPALLWESGSVANTVANGWLSVLVSDGTPSTLVLAPGDYWIAWQVDTLAPVASYAAGAAGDGLYVPMPYGAFPAALEGGTATAAVLSDEVWTQYVNYVIDVPAAPSNPGAIAIGADAITWTWTDNSDDEAGFKVWADPGAAPPATLRATTAVDATSWTYTGLSPNAQYSFQVAGTNLFGDGASTAVYSAYTLANVAAAPVVGNATTTTLDLAIGAGDGNPSETTYAIRCTTTGQWLQGNGTQGAALVYQTAADWGTMAAVGLTPNTAYTFAVVAQNGALASSAQGAGATGTTLVSVPDVVGQAQAAAEAAIVGAALAVGNVTTVYSLDVPAGLVISQNPVGGSGALPGDPVDLLVSLGAISVPNVVGQVQSAAETSITGALLTVGAVTTSHSLTVPAGRVIAQLPAGGTLVLDGAAVDIEVSLGAVSVPNVVGQTQAAAETSITGALLTVGTVTSSHSLTVPAGNVISQSPTAGTQVLDGTAVSIEVSLGAISVPDVVGQTQAAAETAITGALLTVGGVNSEYNITVPAGSVISQSPAAGAQVLDGTAVDLVVSLGAISVPDVVGQTRAAAETAIAGALLTVDEVTAFYSLTVPAGRVISQSPVAGTPVLEGAAVDIAVSLGAINVPNVVGLTQVAAETAITDALLTVGEMTTAYSVTVPAGQVISQAPASGTPVLNGTAVDFVVSLGAISVPNVVGQTQAAAETAITGALLTVGNVTTSYSLTVPAGRVISQSPVGGSFVLNGAAVNLVVSLGAISVPNVVGQTQAGAETAITGALLTVGTVTTSHSLTVPAGNVISQSPGGGTPALAGAAVDIEVSLGAISVPNVVGQAQAAAEAAITGALLTVGSVTTSNSLTVPAGDVISQSPAAGTPVLGGAAVDMVVSLGPQLFDVAYTPSPAAGGTVTGAATIAEGGTATVTVTANAGYSIGSVTASNGSVTATAPYVLSGVTADTTVTATFTANMNSVTYVPSPVAGGTVTGPATVLTGGTATVTVTPGAGYNIGSVTATNGSVTATAPYVLSGVTANTTVTATFTPKSNSVAYVASPVAGGTVTGPATIATGGTATVTVTPGAGYSVGSVTATNGSVTATAPYVLSGVTANTTVTATFTANTNSVAYVASPVAGGTVAGPATVLTGGTATVTVTAGAGYSVGSVTATNGSVTATAPYVLSGVTASTTVTATFTANANSITYVANPVAGGTVTGPATVLTGGTATVSVVPNTGYGIDSVTASNGSVTATAPYALSGVTADTTVTAVFRQLATPVPNVVGQLRATAEAAIIAAGLTVGTVTEAFSATVPSGTVIAQAPLAGVLALPGTAVGLVVSKGPQPVSVPNVIGITAAAARAAITGAGLVVGTVAEEFSATAPLGTVMEQAPVGGASVPPGSAVNIVISKGPSTIMPDVLGMTRDEAETAIVNAILEVGLVVEDYSDTVPAGQVLSQSPAGGTEIAQGVAVSFVVSLGRKTTVPDVSGMTEEEAQTALTAAGLQVQTTEESSETVPAGQVISQTPEPGLTVAQGSIVNLVVSSGPEDNGCGCAGCQSGKGRFTMDGLGEMLGNLLLLGLSVMVLTTMSRFNM